MHEEMIYREAGFAGRTVSPTRAAGSTASQASPPPRLAVVGAGAVGGYFAARAATVGADVALCTRRPFDRLRIVHFGVAGPHGRDAVTAPEIRIVNTPAELAEVDQPTEWVLIATKAHQTAAALPWLERLVGPQTVVIVAQNGVRHVERVSPPVPTSQVLPAVVYLNAELVAPDTVHHRTYGFLQLPDVEAAEHFARAVFPGEGEVRLVADFAAASWTKLVANSASNSLTALTCRRLEVLHRDDVADVAFTLAMEAVAVARADGAHLADDLPELTIQRLRNQPLGAGTSMYYDRVAGRPLEHDALLGAVVRIGAEYGVPTPVSRLVLALLAASSRGADGQASDGRGAGRR